MIFELLQMGFQAVALGGIALEAIGGKGAVAAAYKGPARSLGGSRFFHRLELLGIVKGSLFVSSEIDEHDGFLS
jgi:hypothetical protein